MYMYVMIDCTQLILLQRLITNKACTYMCSIHMNGVGKRCHKWVDVIHNVRTLQACNL